MNKKKVISKTNAIREIERAGKSFEQIVFDVDTSKSIPSGEEVAKILEQNPDQVFKTLVTVGKSGNYFVFMVPVSCELDLKKAALSVNQKSIEMIPQKDLFPLTGYVHGGCSPIGMKKAYKTTIDETALIWDKIYFSGGKIGCQIKMSPQDLAEIIDAAFADLTL